MNNPFDNSQVILDEATIAQLTETMNSIDQLCNDLSKFVMSQEARESVAQLAQQNAELRKSTSELLFHPKKHCHNCLIQTDTLAPIFAVDTNECLECYKFAVENNDHTDFLEIYPQD